MRMGMRMRTYFPVLCSRLLVSHKPATDTEVIRWEYPFNELKNSSSASAGGLMLADL